MADMERDFGRVEATLADLATALREYRAETREGFTGLYRMVNKIDSQGCSKAKLYDDIEQRVRRNEGIIAKAGGVVWVIASFLGLLGGIAGRWISQHIGPSQ